MASLKYASFIQKAILPDQRYLQNILSDYFLLFKPREIVSGDFYYCTRKDELIIVAAGDCTGHGVPGALLSIMGVSFLNEILSNLGTSLGFCNYYEYAIYHRITAFHFCCSLTRIFS